MTVSSKFFQTQTGRSLLFILFLIISFAGNAQSYSYDRTISWQPVKEVNISPSDSFRILMFSGSSRKEEEFGELPVFFERFPLALPSDSLVSLTLENQVFQKIDPADLNQVRDLEKVTSGFETRNFISIQKKKPFLNVALLPVRKNDRTGDFERLISFSLKLDFTPSILTKKKSTPKYAGNSVLAQGNWIKVSIVNTGLYKIPATALKQLDPGYADINPRNIRMYGNGGGMLPEANASYRIDDLREISIQVVGEEDGVFNDGDYILFYGQGPDKWTLSHTDLNFHHQKNIYSDYAYYFVTYGSSAGKRIGTEQSTTLPSTDKISSFNDYAFNEADGVNLIKSGREWYDSQTFEMTTSRNYSFSFPDLDPASPVKVLASVAARSVTVNTSFSVFANGSSEKLMNLVIPATSSNYLDTFAKKGSDTGSFYSSTSGINLDLVYNKVSDAIGWLDFLELNVKRQLKISGNQVGFRSVTGTDAGHVSEFKLHSPGRTSTIWDVTDPGNISQVSTSAAGDTLVFRLPTDSLKEFIAFDGGSFYSVQSAVKISNQNLHGTGQCDYVIITHPSFLSEANQLAAFHQQHDNMTVLVTTPDLIYNEFSSGAQDLCGLRDFVRMLYEKADPGKEPKYVLLFGDASYDYKDRVQNNTNFIPAYESQESLNPVNTFVSDDFIGLLDENEGANAAGDLDVGVGRLPVQTADEAQAAVNKIIHYASNSEAVKNDWRNMLCFVADDEDNNMHMSEAETMTNIVDQSHQEYNINKIYLDAYQQIVTPGGGRYPDVNAAINQQMAKGALIMTYNGHGGTLGWAHERVLEIPDIKGWTNYDNLPLFLTATCEFSKFDDPSWVSAGEWVFLNPTGGGIALLTTTRPTYADGNIELATNFFNHVFNRTDGIFPKLGDLTMISKNLAGPGANTRKFVLLGDPGLTLAYPVQHVVTTAINNQPVGSVPDTLKALASVTVSGEIQDNNGNKLSDFNGTLFPTVYDKESEIITLANDGGTPFGFYLRKNIIYKGQVEVINGAFTFSFIMPKDIAYNYGIGKISYYARSAETDANGYDENIVVGGYSDGSSVDENGPALRLFMNDTTFVSGGLTDQNPKLLAIVRDESGINTVGSGIGHDLVATLDDDSKNPIILNDYYNTDLNTYKRGMITYPFFSLSDGWHTISVKVWDVYNNSSTATITFQVVSSGNLTLQNLINYPNPFLTRTTFSFEYNQPDEDVDARIMIYTLTGKLVKIIDQKINTAGYHPNIIVWDGTQDDGQKVSSGTYPYQLSLRFGDGREIKKSSKMVVIR